MSKSRSTGARSARKQETLATRLSGSLQRLLTEGRLEVLDAVRQTDVSALIVERATEARAPSWMATAQTRNPIERQRTRESYERCLDIYRTVVRPQDKTFDDAGAAAAFFVAVNLNVLQGVETTPELLLLLERQILSLVRQASDWDAASISERQFYFEQMAMLGVFVAGVTAKAREEGPAAIAKVQASARDYLKRVLGMDPDLLTVGARGLEVRKPAGSPQTAA